VSQNAGRHCRLQAAHDGPYGRAMAGGDLRKPHYDRLRVMLRATTGNPTQRTPTQNQTVRTVFVIGPDKRIKLTLAYPMTTGRNFDEVLRVLDSLQLTASHRVATPANWRAGEDVIIAGSVTDDEAMTIWPQGWAAPRPYIRIVPHPDALGA